MLLLADTATMFRQYLLIERHISGLDEPSNAVKMHITPTEISPIVESFCSCFVKHIEAYQDSFVSEAINPMVSTNSFSKTNDYAEKMLYDTVDADAETRRVKSRVS